MAEWMLWKNGLSSSLHYAKPPPFQTGFPLKNFCSIHPCCSMVLVLHSSMYIIHPSANCDDLCLLFCLYLSSMIGTMPGEKVTGCVCVCGMPDLMSVIKSKPREAFHVLFAPTWWGNHKNCRPSSCCSPTTGPVPCEEV